MENTYKGKFMVVEELKEAPVNTMPERDEDLFRMINAKTAERRRAREELERCIYSDCGIAEEYSPELSRIAGGIGWMLLGGLFIAAAVRGWCTAGFGLTMAAGCLIWAINRLRRCGKWESSQYQQKTRKRC